MQREENKIYTIEELKQLGLGVDFVKVEDSPLACRKNLMVSKFTVTQKLFKFVTGKTPSYHTMQILNWDGEMRPVEQVDWYDCIEFCNEMSKMLGLTPAYVITKSDTYFDTEANGISLPFVKEWLYYSKGGKLSKGYKFSGSDNIDEVAWYYNNSEVGGERMIHPVGTKKPNELGLYDCNGNAWEWTASTSEDDSDILNPDGTFKDEVCIKNEDEIAKIKKSALDKYVRD